MGENTNRDRHPSAKPRRKPAQKEDAKLWKETLFPDELPSAPQNDPPPLQPKPIAREDLPPTVQAGEIIEEILEVSEVGEGVERVTRPKKPAYRELLEWVMVFAAATVVVLLVLGFVAEPIHVDGHSMQDTLAPDEYVMVTKFDYLGTAPLRFDVVSCRYPNMHKTFVKRIIGLPGDTIELIAGELYINGQQIAQDFSLRKETEDYGPVTVPPDHYLVMGDNRAVSQDSRDPLVGPLPRSAITGHVRLVIYPLGSMRAIEDKHRVPQPAVTRPPVETEPNP